jgi:hypothetical protein
MDAGTVLPLVPARVLTRLLKHASPKVLSETICGMLVLLPYSCPYLTNNQRTQNKGRDNIRALGCQLILLEPAPPMVT